jgi:hypothetical protein
MSKLALESASHGKHPIIGFGGAFLASCQACLTAAGRHL